MKFSANNIILKLLGLLLLTGAVLKGYELLTEPAANTDIWSNRYFLIFVVEFELALGIWLLSGLFRKFAWLAVVACFSVFCCVTIYKGIAGYGSCGCFGKIHVNPWITLFAIDMPAVALLAIFRPKQLTVKSIIRPLELLRPWPGLSHLLGVTVIGLAVITISLPVLALNEPAKVTSGYEVLEPETWIGKELPILEHIDIADKLKTGNWLIVLYHHDCPNCAETIPRIEGMAKDFKGNEDFLRFALIEVPPYGHENSLIGNDSLCKLGKLDRSKQWLTATPTSVYIQEGNVRKSWEKAIPLLENLVNVRFQEITFENKIMSNRERRCL